MIALRTTVDRATADLVTVVKTIADLVAAEDRTRKGM
jgi:hypothetical protein